MKGFADFDLDLKYGIDREHVLHDILSGTTIELKSDRKAAVTGNFFLEFEQRGRPSGIAVTRAEFWAIETAPNTFILLPTKRLKDIGARFFKERGYVLGGDGNNFKGVLVPLKALLQSGP